MRIIKLLMEALILVLLSGCATSPENKAPPQLERISAKDLDRIMTKPPPVLTLDQIARLSQEGSSPEDIIEKIKQTGSSYQLTPTQILDLHAQGVDKSVLNFIHAAREQVVRDGFADEINKRERRHKSEMDALKRQPDFPYAYYDPFWGPYPYGHWPYRIYPGGGVYWGK